MIASCIYEGSIRHRRFDRRRDLCHRLALAYVDLDEVGELLDGRLLAPGPGSLRFRRSDYHGDPAVPLKVAVGDTVELALGRRPLGPVRMLAHLRSCGICFNPVSFYYCFDGHGERLEAVLAEVTNTPWGERHSYVMAGGLDRGRVASGSFSKALHVSPFMAMDHRYEVRAATPSATLAVHIESRRAGILAFDATLRLARRELSRSSAASMSVRYGAASARVLALIYGHALALKLQGVPTHRHPGAGVE